MTFDDDIDTWHCAVTLH